MICPYHFRIAGIVPWSTYRREMMKWKIEYDNDTGPDDGGFFEWWTVTDGEREFKANTEDDAKWLAEILNNLPA